MNIVKSADVLRRVADTFELLDDVRSVETSPDVVLAKFLGAMADLFQECRVRYEAVINSWCNEADDEWPIIVFP